MIYKRNNSQYFWYRIYVPGSHKKTGKRKELRGSTGAKDEATARAIEQTIKMSLHRQAPVDKLHAMIDALSGMNQEMKGFPVAALFNEYMRVVKTTKKTISERTVYDRKRHCESLVEWCGTQGIDNIEQLTKQAALRFAEFLAKRGTKGKTRANIIGDLSAVWNTLIRTHDIINPWLLVSPEKSDSERGKAFTIDDEKAVLSAASEIGEGWHLACLVARHTGLRYADVAGLSWSDFDFNKNILHIEPGKTRRWKINVIVPLAGELSNELKELREHSTSEYILPGFALKLPRQFEKPPFKDILERAGLTDKGYTFHSWRHTFRTRLSEAGVSDDLAKRLGGWTEDKTVQRYDHAERLDELRAAIEKSRTLSE